MPSGDLGASLRPLLQTQLRALRARYAVHGLLRTATLLAGAVLLFFGLDRWLLLPLPIRLFHTAATLGLLAFGLWRFVRYPLQKRFADLDAAIWFERTFPSLHQRLVSAIQLQALPEPALRNQSAAMIEALQRDTESAVRALPLQQLFDARPTARLGTAVLLAVLVLGGGACWSPATAHAFVCRHLGLPASYPRDTTLRLELPPAGPELQREDRGDVTELVLAAGADLHVAVLAEGVVPKEVFLDLSPTAEDTRRDQRSVAMTPRPAGRFRHVFRRLAGSFEFHARGGDDDQGDRRVVVRTVHPPQVATLQATIDPPAYAGVAKLTQQGGAIEALVGSQVELELSTTIAVRSATMVFLESGRRLPFAPISIEDDGGAARRHRVRFPVEASDRYQVELLAENGLRNPNPGTYPIAALQDYAPVGRWLLPEDEGLAVLPTGIVCVRLEARDDFGLASVALGVERGGQRVGSSALLANPAGLPTTGTVLTELLEVRDLLGDGKDAQEGLVLQVKLTDGKQPTAGETELPQRIVQVVDAPQLVAIIARLFRGLREEASQALDIQSDRKARLEELAGATPTAGGDLVQQLTGIEVGQGRLAAATERVHRGLMRAFDLHLWNRLEPSQHAARVVELYRERARGLREPVALDPEFYRDLLVRRSGGSLGAMEQTLDPILGMFGLADQLVQRDGPQVARALAEAQVARDATERASQLQRAAAAQQRIETGLQQLLLRLEEWNDYQDLIQGVRALRDSQRDLQGRTEELQGKK
jgi:hypothetical protein